jgi:pantetheine-phosphate adenylyltransferase
MLSSTTAVFPGSFDPFTKGHEAMVLRALQLYSKIIIAIGKNTNKQYLFTPEERLNHIQSLFKKHPSIEVKFYEGLTVNFCKSNNAKVIIRGLRDVKDFEYEKSIAWMNNDMEPEIQTVFLLTEPKYMAVNSVIVREIYKSGGSIEKFVPQTIFNLISKN